MKYVYPKFSNFDCGFFRIGGCGLGNMLFIYSRALVLAKENDATLIYPTWPTFKLGPILRREKDKRFYFGLFSNKSQRPSKLKKIKLLYLNRKVTPEQLQSAPDNSVVIYDNFKMKFDELIKYRDFIYDDIIKNLHDRNRDVLGSDLKSTVAVHIRLGDFKPFNEEDIKNGKNNIQINVSWYSKVINQINEATNFKYNFLVFSDGEEEELKEVLNVPNVTLSKKRNIIEDILLMSKSEFLIASGSSTSLWARFLGELSSLTFTNQLKEKGLSKPDGFEIEAGEEGLSLEQLDIIKSHS